MYQGVSENKYVICPECSGTGKKGLFRTCPNCLGMGVGTFYRDHFFYWKPQLNVARIELDRFRDKVNFIINIIAIVVAVIGVLCLFVWFYTVSTFTIRIEEFAFWTKNHPLLFFFWLTVFADFFIIYRFSREAIEDKKIKLFKYDTRNVRLKTSNNWKELRLASSKEKINVSEAFSKSSLRLIDDTYILTTKLKHKDMSPMHLFFTCLSDQEVVAVLSRLNVKAKDLLERIKRHLSDRAVPSKATIVPNETRQALIDAYIDSCELGQEKVTPKNILLALVKYDKTIFDILSEMEVDPAKIANVIHWFSVNEIQIAKYKKFRRLSQFKPASNMDRAYTAVATPILNSYAYDLTIAAKWSKLDYCVARDEEIDEIWDHVEGGASGILLVGDEGVGKRTIIYGVAQKMVEEDVPNFFKDKRLMELDLARLVSGVNPSEAEGRMMSIVDEVQEAGNIILFVKDIESIIGISSGSEGALDLSEVLSNALSRKLLFVFASVETRNYLKYMEGKSLDLSLEKVDVNEKKEDQAIQIIASKISGMESNHGVYFSYNAIDEAVNLSDKYIHDQFLPKKAIKILDLAAVRVAKKKMDFPFVTKDIVREIVSEISKVPVNKVSQTEGKELLNLEERIHERMINQKEAVDMVSDSLRRARAELREGVRPIASFLFLGPTGVGKTELAKSVSAIYFGDEKYMIRVYMSEYQHADSVKKMIGDSDNKGYLTEKVRKSPFSLVLLDEIEKANPEILNLFLQVMDDGRLTDGQGQTIDFTNTIIIATSNAGSDYIQDAVFKGVEIEEIRDKLINEHINQIMRPELINRFDGIIVFEPLSQDNIFRITKLMLGGIESMLEEKGIEFEINDDGVMKLAKEGYDPKFGARPLRRLLQDKIENEIANKILSGELKRRDKVVLTDEAKILIEKGVKL